MKKIAVIGTGYVGLVSGTCFAEIGNKVVCCDIDESKIRSLKNGVIPIYEPGLADLVEKNVLDQRLTFTNDIPSAIRASDIIYIAVGTPMSKTGEADLTYVKAAAKTIGEHLNGYKVIVNKSTVPVGTGKLVQSIVQKASKGRYSFDVVSNPEFLREGSAIHDTMNMERAVIGSTSHKAAAIIEELHQPFHAPVIKTNLESAEMIKYAANAFLATKISFINDIANICERVGADVSKLLMVLVLTAVSAESSLKLVLDSAVHVFQRIQPRCFKSQNRQAIHSSSSKLSLKRTKSSVFIL